ncbi:putative polygalacturonase-like [Capsicum annuum]|nr:putative polygalacturonase-like [Capsicum annuum]
MAKNVSLDSVEPILAMAKQCSHATAPHLPLLFKAKLDHQMSDIFIVNVEGVVAGAKAAVVATVIPTVANKEEEKQHEDLKEEVKKMLVMAPSKSLQKLDLINTIQRFCVDYHFAHEIEESLSYMYTHYEEWISEVDGNDLHAIALCFRLLRQQGYYVSCDAFRKFTDNQGNFKKELVNDVHGMLSLYEAAQYRVHDEEILDEALNFTITQLKLILPKLSNSHLAQQVSNALKFSIKDGVVKVETKKYISFYQENHESCNQVLLNFAKLDFNILQRLHKKKLCDITRWNIDASEQLPSYMKIIYRGLVDVFNEVEKELASENKSFLIDYCITEMKKVSRAYFQEAKWYHEKKVPALKQYIKNGIPSSGCQLFATACCVGLGKVATKDALDWLASEPPILDALCNIGRLLNDFTSHEMYYLVWDVEHPEKHHDFGCCGRFRPDGGVEKKARICITRHFNGYWISWQKVPELDRDRMLEEFKDEYMRLVGVYHSSQPPESQGDSIPQHVEEELWVLQIGVIWLPGSLDDFSTDDDMEDEDEFVDDDF